MAFAGTLWKEEKLYGMRREHIEYIDGQAFVVEEPPYRAIFLAFGLFTLGSILLTVGALILTGHIDVGKHYETLSDVS